MKYEPKAMKQIIAYREFFKSFQFSKKRRKALAKQTYKLANDLASFDNNK